ncbi:hypothetical protein FDI69_gp007 [Rhodococcus phage Trina]|uniref:Uncharacterized protein n=1 Tax=Rhodococcus phage Trina TaxID=2027905 RepID=A0A2D0ZM42_9CAUD|nr:hypothetical protein FDI69_gp007 [Rhodococcus phage Trina]ASZ74825.1 hypothetical protein SEA_TRINA_7 [Rhodococcus phage Trina]
MLAEQLSGRDLGRQISCRVQIGKQLVQRSGRILSITHDIYGVKLKLDTGATELQLTPSREVTVI